MLPAPFRPFISSSFSALRLCAIANAGKAHGARRPALLAARPQRRAGEIPPAPVRESKSPGSPRSCSGRQAQGPAGLSRFEVWAGRPPRMARSMAQGNKGTVFVAPAS